MNRRYAPLTTEADIAAFLRRLRRDGNIDKFVRSAGETIVLEAPEAPAIIARAMALGKA